VQSTLPAFASPHPKNPRPQPLKQDTDRQTDRKKERKRERERERERERGDRNQKKKGEEEEKKKMSLTRNLKVDSHKSKIKNQKSKISDRCTPRCITISQSMYIDVHTYIRRLLVRK
jgi:hypothetical protein